VIKMIEECTKVEVKTTIDFWSMQFALESVKNEFCNQ
jgi:hypothetical protein